LRRLVQAALAAVLLVALSPVLMLGIALVWLTDRRNPFYVAPRVGIGGAPFSMVKLRTMVVDADKTGVDSTSATDHRITFVGRLLRRLKLDELPQLFNVVKGDMDLVGPRPNVEREVALYTAEERRLLEVRPGITDLASIVFSDEGDILDGATDPDLLYNQIIRPWKNRLGLMCVDQRSAALDLRIVFLTVLNSVSRERALRSVQRIVRQLGAEPYLASVAGRTVDLPPAPPPGASEIVRDRLAPPPSVD
jgi:lipopolysaccharide/colanic/teichoic acid biosynthesis glycosyltransferase